MLLPSNPERSRRGPGSARAAEGAGRASGEQTPGRAFRKGIRRRMAVASLAGLSRAGSERRQARRRTRLAALPSLLRGAGVSPGQRPQLHPAQ